MCTNSMCVIGIFDTQLKTPKLILDKNICYPRGYVESNLVARFV